MKISIVSPVYKADDIIDELVKKINENVSKITEKFEIILVEDGSPDNSWKRIEAMCVKDTKIKGIKLSRNFGQHYAITAGLEAALGEWIVVMDCDLQDRPEEIPNLYKKTKEGYDLVFARRKNRQDVGFKKLSSKLFYIVFGYLTDTKQDSTIANFGIYHKKVISSILAMKDHIRYFPTMSQWVGYSKGYLDVGHAERETGRSSYSWNKMLMLAFNNIIAFSNKPLRLTIQIGLLVSGIAGLMGLVYLYKYFSGEIVVIGFASLIISVWFLSGIIIFILGILGIYIGKTFDNVKERPIFIVEKKVNIDE